MDKFKASFRFYEKAAPFPGYCFRCGTSDKLWHLGEVRGTNMAAFYCDGCLCELARYTGMVDKHIHENATSELTNKVEQLEAQLSAAPKLLKELSNNVNSILGEFVTSLAGVASSSGTSGAKGNKASTRSTKADAGASSEAGEGASESAEPSVESAGE